MNFKDKNGKKTLIIFCAVTAVFVALICVFSFFDLQISKKISIIGAGKYYPESVSGRFFETFGVIPVYALTAFALALVFHNALRRSALTERGKIFKVFVLILSAFFTALMCFGMFKKAISYTLIHFSADYLLGGGTDMVAFVLLGIMSGAALLYFCKDLSSSFLNKTFCWALIVIFAAAFSQGITQGIKLFSGRARFATMNVLNDFSLYTPWYKFVSGRKVTDDMLTAGIASDAFRSFPSGHSAASTMLLCFCLLPYFLRGEKGENKPLKLVCLILPIAFTLGTMASRVIEGAHFLTDVLFGSYSVIAGIFIAICFIPSLAKRLTPLCEKVGVICENAENNQIGG